MIQYGIVPIDWASAPLPETEKKTLPFSKGFLEGYPTAEGFCLSRVISTDLQAYLEFLPGQELKESQLRELQRETIFTGGKQHSWEKGS